MIDIKIDEEKKDQLPEYVPPEITTYTDEELVEELGPAQTFTSYIGDNLFQ